MLELPGTEESLRRLSSPNFTSKGVFLNVMFRVESLRQYADRLCSTCLGSGWRLVCFSPGTRYQTFICRCAKEGIKKKIPGAIT